MWQARSRYGSAFTSAAGAWDLRHLVSTHRSVLRKLGFSVQGLTYPWLYFGALFATFCWHVEDHFLYSVNYLHTGAPKTWCAAPSPFLFNAVSEGDTTRLLASLLHRAWHERHTSL